MINWVQANFEYDHHDASLAAKAEHALTKHRGHCSDYHSLRIHGKSTGRSHSRDLWN
ncbi:MAG: hypothetical protein U0894_09965 [Pirellulales bacterium]